MQLLGGDREVKPAHVKLHACLGVGLGLGLWFGLGVGLGVGVRALTLTKSPNPNPNAHVARHACFGRCATEATSAEANLCGAGAWVGWVLG